MDALFVQALWVLGLLAADRLPEVARGALEAGLDSPSLRMLASLMPNELAEAPDLFVRSWTELGFLPMSRPAAARKYAIVVSGQIASGVITPEDGAKKIWDASVRVNDPSFHELDTFIYAASELQSRPEDRDFFNGEILKEAKIWDSVSRELALLPQRD